MTGKEERSCWNCAHKIGGKYCPLERKVESALRAKVLEVHKNSENDEDAIRKLTSGKISVRVVDGEDEVVRLVELSGSEARKRIGDKEKRDPHGPYMGEPCENWEAEEPYAVEEMMEISDEANLSSRYQGRSSEEVTRYKKQRDRGEK